MTNRRRQTGNGGTAGARGWRTVMTAVLLLATAAYASDAWNRPMDTWTPGDIAQLLNESPWARRAEVKVPERAEGKKEDARREVYVARWASSRMMRQAAARLEVLRGGAPPDANEFLVTTPATYQLRVIGTDMTPFAHVTEEALRNGAALEVGSAHRKIAASSVKIVWSDDGARVRSVGCDFPRKDERGAATLGDDKTVEFVISGEALTLRFRFDVGKMSRQGTPDL